MAACKIATPEELFNNALTLFDYAIKAITEGRIIAAVNEKNQKYREIEMEVFKNVQP